MLIFTVWTFILDWKEASAFYALFAYYVGIIIAYLAKVNLQKVHTWLHLAISKAQQRFQSLWGMQSGSE